MISYSRFQFQKTSYYPFAEPFSQDYRVYINGEEAAVYTCRISEFPFNTIWPGYPAHQRPVDQTVPASFVNIVADEEVTVEVEPLIPCPKPLLKPYARGVVPVWKNNRYRMVLREDGGYVFMCADHRRCLYLFKTTPLTCEDPGSVTHYFGPGIHFPGKIVLQDEDRVYIDKDALVYGCIFAKGAKNIRIFGNGILDDSMEERVGNYCYEPYTNGNVKFYDCENLRIEGVGMKNSAIWCVNLFHCRNVLLDGIKVFGQWRYNTDGVDVVNSQYIQIRNSFIHSFDDTITIKGIDAYKETDNCHIFVENCVLWCDWGKTCEIGLETCCREYYDISFEKCCILRAGNTALDIQNGDCAEVHDIRFTDIDVEYNAFETPPVSQRTEEQIYDRGREFFIPALVSVRNYPFKTPGSIQRWGLYVGELPNLEGIRQACVHDIVIDQVNVWYDDALPRNEDGTYQVFALMVIDREETEYENISITNVSVNGTPVSVPIFDSV